MSRQVTKIIPCFNSDHELENVDFYFKHSGDEPFTSGEFTQGSRTKQLLQEIETLIIRLNNVSADVREFPEDETS